MNDSDALVQRLKTRDPYFDGVVLDYQTKTLYQNEINYKNFTYKICPESVMPSFVVAYLRKNHYLVDEFNQQIEAMKANGLRRMLVQKYTSSRHGTIKGDSYQPSQLKIENLRGAFEILGYGLLISFTGFTLEFIIAKITNLFVKKNKVFLR